MSPKTVPSGQKRAISGHESERRYLESLIRTDYERCHPNDSFEDLKRRATFRKRRIEVCCGTGSPLRRGP